MKPLTTEQIQQLGPIIKFYEASLSRVSQNIRGPGCWICAVVSGFVAARRPPTGWRAACLMCFEIELLWLVSGDRHIEEKKKKENQGPVKYPVAETGP
jgi:hypothetical protein